MRNTGANDAHPGERDVIAVRSGGPLDPVVYGRLPTTKLPPDRWKVRAW